MDIIESSNSAHFLPNFGSNVPVKIDFKKIIKVVTKSNYQSFIAKFMQVLFLAANHGNQKNLNPITYSVFLIFSAYSPLTSANSSLFSELTLVWLVVGYQLGEAKRVCILCIEKRIFFERLAPLLQNTVDFF